MSQSKKPAKKPAPVVKRTARVNFKAIAILTGLLVLVSLVFFLFKARTTESIRASALAQSKESFDRAEYDLALRHIDRFLTDHPDDILALEAKADLLSKTASNPDKLLQATQVHDQLIRLDPNGKNRLETRRKLIELYITFGEFVRIFADEQSNGKIEAAESRYLAAVEAADELIKYKDPVTGIENGTVDSTAHRLKAMAYMGQVPGLIAKNGEEIRSLDEAEKELDKALAIDPGDVIASEKLAELYMIHRADPIRAEKTLDEMLVALQKKKFADEKEANEAALKVRLSRFRAFYLSKEITKSQKELEAALKFAPENIDLLTSAAGLALQRHETQECRRYLDAIPLAFQKDNLRIRLLRGELEFAERHPDEAIDQWRKGLSIVGGGDLDLTWRLAANLIQFSRLVEARPLMDQYLRLAKPNDPKGIYLEGMYNEKSGHINRAIELMTKASTLVSLSYKADVLMSLAHCYELIGDENKALYKYKEAANLGGAATGPRRAMARLYLATNPARAIEELETAYSASKAIGKSRFSPADGSDLQLLAPSSDDSKLPNSGKNSVVIASVNDLLHFRFFDKEGRLVLDTDEKRLKEKGKSVDELKLQLKTLWPPHQLSVPEKERVLTKLTTVADETSREAKGDPNVLIELIRVKMDRQMKLAKADRDFREVASLLAEAREIAPQNPAIQALTAQYQSFDNHLDLAVKTLEETVQGTNRKRTESWLAYAEALELLGRIPDAIEKLDKGSEPDAAGDHASLRANKARLLLRLGQGTRAKAVLTTNVNSVPEPERAELSKSLGDLLQELGDRAGARNAYLEWSRLAPESPFPALKLLSIAQIEGDKESAKAGIEALANAGRSNEPYALAAQALQLLSMDATTSGQIAKSRLDEAEKLVEKLNIVAPEFPVKYMIQGMILEAKADPKNPPQWRESLSKAGEAYRKSIKVGAASPALPKLIEIYLKLQDDEKLNLLKVEYDDGTRRLKTEIAVEFDRLSTLIALKLGDKERAAKSLKKMAEGRPDNRDVRFAEARMYDALGKLDEAEKALLDIVKLRPDDPETWLELIRFQKSKRKPADVARTIELARQKYIGDRPELFVARCYAAINDVSNANREYQKALDVRPDDLVSLRTFAEFLESTGQGDRVEPLLRKILKYDSGSAWASRSLALKISSRTDPASWAEAWALVAPGSTFSGETSEDRLIRATILARSPESARRAEAIPAFAELANDLPISDMVGIDARLRLSQAMLEMNRPQEALKYVGPICDDLTRGNPVALAIGIEAFARLGNGPEAEKRYERLNKIVPNIFQTGLSRAWVDHALGNKAAVSKTLFDLYAKAELLPQGEAVAVSCLDLLLKFDDLDSADQLARKMEAKWPREAANVARVQVARKEYDNVLASCRKALAAGAAREAVQYATASAIVRRKDSDFVKKAEEICENGRNKAPNDHNILIYMATLRHVQDRYQDEMAFYRMALEKNPPNCQFLNNMAWTLCEGLNQPDEALKWIDVIIKRDGPAAEYLDTRGVIYSRKNDYNKAIEDLENAVKGDPSPIIYYHLSRAYLLAGNMPDFRRCRDLAVAKGFSMSMLDPTDKWRVEEVMDKTAKP